MPRIKRPCNYVYLNIAGRAGTRDELYRWQQEALAAGRFLHTVDPCALTHGHRREHLLSTVARPAKDTES